MRRMFVKLVLLSVLVAAGQYGLYRLQPERTPVFIVREMMHARKPGIVYLGDSVNAFASATDTNRASVAMMLSEKLQQRVRGISRGGFTLMMYRDFLRDWVRFAPTGQTVVVEVNLAGLQGSGREPYTLHQEIAFELRQQGSLFLRVFERPLRIFRFPMLRPAIRMEEYLHEDLVWQGQKVGKRREFQDQRFLVANVSDELVRWNLVTRYGQPMAPDNRMIAALKEIGRLLKAHGHRAVFYVTPVDYQRCDRYWDGAISPILRDKAAAARAAVAAGGGEFLDFTFALGHEHFDPAHYPNEHMKESGRNWVAQALADYLMR